ncbi:uncharacterized protein EHS24_001914 [Apiotrichum porosum]|uniref:BAG domain-containing protein n=1 Tax=Apiotrichum porosum TaxID=105984 RepID=A0A427XJI9_9TREE|nr:uncharacterized protein EHS24_001914 [Apiotrichum porosum]RSH78988.1 hypothetical protein EHS24_001914 [Apiotrichum porosum]
MSFYGHPFVPVQQGYYRPAQAQQASAEQQQQRAASPITVSDLEAEERTALAYLRSVQRRREAAEAAAAIESRQRAAAAQQREIALRAAREQQARAIACARRERAIKEALERERAREAALAHALEQRRRDQIAAAVQAERQRQVAAAHAYERALAEYRARAEQVQTAQAKAHQVHAAAHARAQAEQRVRAPGAPLLAAAPAAREAAAEDNDDDDLAGINSLLGSLFGFNIGSGQESELDARCQCPPAQEPAKVPQRDIAAAPNAATAAALTVPAEHAHAGLNPAAKAFVPEHDDTAATAEDDASFPPGLNSLLNAFLGLQVDPAAQDEKAASGSQQVVGSAVNNLNDILSRWGLEFVPDESATEDLSQVEKLAAAEKTARTIAGEQSASYARKTEDIREAERIAKAEGIAQNIAKHEQAQAAARNPALGEAENLATAVGTAKAISTEDAHYTADKTKDVRAAEQLAKAEGIAARLAAEEQAAAAARNPALGETEKLAAAVNTAKDIQKEDAQYEHDKSNAQDLATTEQLAKAEGIAERLDREEAADAAARNPALGEAEKLATAVNTASDIAKEDFAAIHARDAKKQADYEANKQKQAEADRHVPALPTRVAVHPHPHREPPVVREDFQRAQEPQPQQDFVEGAPFTSTLDNYANMPQALRDILAAVEGSMNDQAAAHKKTKKHRPGRKERQQRKAATATEPAAPETPEEAEARKVAEAQLDTIDAKFAALNTSFTFPPRLVFAASTPDHNQPPLLFNRYNTPYHAQANALLQLILEADGVQSNGDRAIRRRRKDTVAAIEKELESLEARRDQRWHEVSERRERGETDDEDEWTRSSASATESETEGYEVL